MRYRDIAELAPFVLQKYQYKHVKQGLFSGLGSILGHTKHSNSLKMPIPLDAAPLILNLIDHL